MNEKPTVLDSVNHANAINIPQQLIHIHSMINAISEYVFTINNNLLTKFFGSDQVSIRFRRKAQKKIFLLF